MIARRVEHLMGMPISLAVRGEMSDGSVRAWAEALDSLADADAMFSTYRSESWVERRNRGEVTDDAAPADVADVYALADRWRQESGGAFDIWRMGRLDPSGVVKGWAVQRAARYLLRSGQDFCLSAGGDMVCWARTEPWQIGVEDPRDATRIVARIPVLRGGVATSGIAHRGAHVVDARTGDVPRTLAAVTVVAKSLLRADLDATAAYALGPDGPDWLRGRAGATSVLVFPDGRVRTIVGAQINDNAMNTLLGSSTYAPNGAHTSNPARRYIVRAGSK